MVYSRSAPSEKDLISTFAPRFGPPQLLHESGSEGSAGKFQQEILGGAAFELPAVHPADEIDQESIALRRLAGLGHGLEDSLRLREALDRLVDLAVGNLDHEPFELQLGKFHGLDVGHQLDFHGVFEIGPFRERLDLDLRLQGGTQPLVRQRPGRTVGNRALEDLLHQGRAVLFSQQRNRHFPGTESRHFDRLAQFHKAALQLFLDVLGGDGDLEFAPQSLASGFDDLHGIYCPC